jgi:hypothetical protein
VSADQEKPGRRKMSDKAKVEKLRARAEVALADVRRRSEYLSGPRGKKGA